MRNSVIPISGIRRTVRRRAGISLASIIDQVAQWWEVAAERRRLAAMDDRMLSDIGLTRADVWRETNRPFWDVPDDTSRRDR